MKIISVLLFIIMLFSGYKIVWLRASSVASPTGRLNLAVFSSEGIWLFSFGNSNTERLQGVFVPGDVYIDAARGAGKYEARKLAKLGEIKGEGANFIRDSVIRFYQVPVDELIVADEFSSVEDLRKIFTLGESIGQSKLLNGLPIWDRIRIWWEVRRLVLSDMQVADIAKTRAVVEEKQPDGISVQVGNIELLPTSIRQSFIEPVVADEKIAVVVFNTTDIGGLADLTAAIIENIGGDVIKVDNSQADSESCQIRVQDKARASKSLQRIKQIFSCSVSEELPETTIGEMEIYIGEEFGDKMFGS